MVNKLRIETLPYRLAKGIIYDFTADGIKRFYGDENSSYREDIFNAWDLVNIKTKCIDDNEKYEVSMKYKTHQPYGIPSLYGYDEIECEETFYLQKSDAYKIKEMYDKRNERMLSNREKINALVDEYVCNMADNFLCIIEDDYMLNLSVVFLLHNAYSYCYDYSVKGVYKDTCFCKGKQKKEAEQYNDTLRKMVNNIKEVISNFVDIIIEKEKYSPEIARAVVWEAIEQTTVKYYSNRWLEEYEQYIPTQLETMTNIEGTVMEYIKTVILCDEIDITDEKNISMLTYYIMSKIQGKKVTFPSAYISVREKINKISQELKSDDIKNKLLTPQTRKVTNYSIDDIDMMDGAEFEEFVALLFRKMGYSAQVTKTSGDQGLDVIAKRNNKVFGIQAKCYGNTVGNSAVQEAVAGKSFYKCDKVIVVTNNYFTSSAVELAEVNNVLLWNRDILKDKIKEQFSK